VTVDDMTPDGVDDDVRRNREWWDGDADAYQAAHREQFDRELLAWGVWGIPEADVGALGDVTGADVLELGCGAAQWSVGLALEGAVPIGLDVSGAQLRHARRRARRARARVPLVQASATTLPFCDESFDVVCCDHGATSFCDPRLVVPEVARVLRRGGRLVFCTATPLLYMTYDAPRDRQGRRLRNPWFGRRRWEFGDGTVDWCVPTGEWLRLFAAHGMAADDLVELQPPADATTTFDGYVPLAWARRWPAEQIWKVRKR
jgi:SAM-dependent methyltransferase